MCDHYSGYTALFKDNITEVGCVADVRRKFHDLRASKKSPVAEGALQFFGAICAVETHARGLDVQDRAWLRQIDTNPILTRFHDWLVFQRQRAAKGTPLAKAIDGTEGEPQTSSRPTGVLLTPLLTPPQVGVPTGEPICTENSAAPAEAAKLRTTTPAMIDG